MPAILPGATIGILGGGQLGRMTAMAARSLGYDVAVLDPDPDCAAAAVASRVVAASFDDPGGAEALARGTAVVTYEIEKIAVAALEAAAALAPVRPAPRVLALVQDRARQKAWLAREGFPVGPYREVGNDADLAAAAALGPYRLKACQGGYDGRSQARVPTPQDAVAAWASLGRAPAVAERELSLDRELSVLVARRPAGEVAVFPPAQNWHQDGILSISVLPGPLPDDLAARASAIARDIAVRLGVEGLLAVEFFATREGDLFVNELSPRPHNTFHAAETACLTSQFEQLVRAICDLPLGSTRVLRPTALANLLGDLWLGPSPPALDRALALPGVRLNLYGKTPRRGRKIGHLLGVADTAGEALALVREARRLLGG
jgi:5-(carboxyamino)imidazole ribonucleotide synthase